MGKHTAFILRPIEKILDDAASAVRGVCGISRVPLNEYFLQSVFLKMTGEQEQKMKCICWELATDDYVYRYQRYNGKWELGECSTLKDKNTIYNDLFDRLTNFNITEGEIQNIKNQVEVIVKKFYFDAHLNAGNERQYKDFEMKYKDIKPEEIYKVNNNRVQLLGYKKGEQILTGSVAKMYELLYKHRNRCAHNTLSYQEPSITFTKLKSKDFIYENYFLRFALLIIIDKLFILAYEKYLENLDNNIF